MVKLVSKIVGFFLLFGIILSMLDNCSGNIFDSFLDNLKDNKSEDEISAEDIKETDPIHLSQYVNVALAQYNQQYIDYNSTNISIEQDITVVNNYIQECIQSVSQQNKYINETNINQSILLDWIEKNTTNITYLESRYDEINNRIDAISKKIKKLKSDITKLEIAVNGNKWGRGKKQTHPNDYKYWISVKQELEKKIKILHDTIGQLRIIKNTIDNHALNDCLRQLKDINKKLDTLIAQGNNRDTEQEENISYYFVIGTEKELKDNNIVSSDGLFARLKVNPSPDKQYFGILTDKNKTIVLGSEDEEFDVVSDHPADSYEVKTVNRAKILVINDIDRFLGNSIYLVIIRK